MELELFKTLVALTEAKAETKEPVKVAKEPELKVEPKSDDAMSTVDSSASKYFFRPKFDSYGVLVQTDNVEARREAKRIYSLLGAEQERHQVFGISQASAHEFKRTAKLLGISTDGEVTLDRVKRAGFTLAGRIGTKRLMKRGDFLVVLSGPHDDKTEAAFYTVKPQEKEDA